MMLLIQKLYYVHKPCWMYFALVCCHLVWRMCSAVTLLVVFFSSSCVCNSPSLFVPLYAFRLQERLDWPMRTILLHNSIANNPCRTCWRSICYGNTQLATEWSMSLATPAHTSQALLVSHLLYMQALHILWRCTAGNRVVPQAGLHHPIPHQCCRFHSGSGLRRCFHQEDLRGRFSAASHQLCGEVSHCECCCFNCSGSCTPAHHLQ